MNLCLAVSPAGSSLKTKQFQALPLMNRGGVSTQKFMFGAGAVPLFVTSAMNENLSPGRFHLTFGVTRKSLKYGRKISHSGGVPVVPSGHTPSTGPPVI